MTRAEYQAQKAMKARMRQTEQKHTQAAKGSMDLPFLILTLVGIVYICETLSDIIQVTYFKLTHGKRIFKMAPLHHHFEMCGWKETKIVAVFSTVSALFCLLAYFAVYQRFSF